MNDYKENLPINEVPQDIVDISVANAMQEVRMTNDLSAGEESWLEKLFHFMTQPISDLIDDAAASHSTERITPQTTTEQIEESAEGYKITDATEEWHVQAGDNSCAVCSQQFIINEFLDLDLSEEQLCVIAEANDWFDPEEGTTPANADNLLELFGIDTHISYEAGYEDLKQTLDNGGRAIVGVDGMVLWVEGAGNFPVSGADHAIEVIGIDESDPDNVKVIINDSGSQDGCGRELPLEEFMEAWLPSGGFMVSAYPKD